MPANDDHQPLRSESLITSRLVLPVMKGREAVAAVCQQGRMLPAFLRFLLAPSATVAVPVAGSEEQFEKQKKAAPTLVSTICVA